MSVIEDAVAFVGITSFAFASINILANWGTKLVHWVPSHSVIASGIAGGLAGIGSGLTLAGIGFFPEQVEQFWKAQEIDSARTRYMMKRVLIFSLPFFMVILFTKPTAALVGRKISLSHMASYAIFDAFLSLSGYNLLRN